MGIVLEFIKKESGKHFDAKLAEILLKNVDKFVAVCEDYPD
jgi:response regulator RpfG family c-di-GMP phosphodiesterase